MRTLCTGRATNAQRPAVVRIRNVADAHSLTPRSARLTRNQDVGEVSFLVPRLGIVAAPGDGSGEGLDFASIDGLEVDRSALQDGPVVVGGTTPAKLVTGEVEHVSIFLARECGLP